tara:strand:+ start:488 stop:619 length:132 start_codon:yes stop_codon:yes gene_type:complete
VKDKDGLGKGEIIWAMLMVALVIGIPIVATLWANCVLLDEICS